ncbi:MAG: polysaccharide biosynthesis C-terminal domain-containing protein [Erysipelotrichaceae bacterium]|nr:polysaccharide biosynthesis C-terminal domain-containing protein [Erysipelotrichaceae bacterium]
MTLEKRLRQYIIPNMFATIGMSCYILIDTLFISIAEGTNGITALNLALPIYSLIFAIGSMIGMGFATRYTIIKENNKDVSKMMFSHAIMWELLLSIIFVLLGLFCSSMILKIMGGDEIILKTGTTYLKIVLICAPFFMLNNTIVPFVRNDYAPKHAMIATLLSSFYNIVFDYIFIFPMHMGMAGAALATGTAPIMSMLVCMIHYLSKKNTIKFHFVFPSIKYLIQACQLGTSYFINEIASGITTTAFNYILLGLDGNIAVAAYGVIANYALVGNSLFNGISQGQQPLLSELYGQGNIEGTRRVLKHALFIGLGIAGCLIVIVVLFSSQLVSLFNSDGSKMLEIYANKGMIIYFIGYIFASMNMIRASYFSATNKPKKSFMIAISRGILSIIVFALILSKLFGMTGVWLSFPVAELFTLLITMKE